MKLIIVESPTKARTLTRFLGGKYIVEATMGHIRDLPKSELGVDVENNFAPRYVIPRDKAKRVSELKKIAQKATSILLATDPDREGEAIAFHVGQILKKNGPFKRIVFHEITQTAIAEAVAHPREIDMPLVDAQQARRVLDRLVGYKLSPLLWKKLSKRWLSAGRVQSVAVRLIVEREREITKFEKKEYWTISGLFDKEITAQLVSHEAIKYEQILIFNLFDGKYTTSCSIIDSKRKAESIQNDLRSPFTVSAVDKKEVHRAPPAPYTTSTLQQEAGRKLYFSAKRTMQLAQKLYEEGYITYHRTDSVNLSDKFTDEARDYITKIYGKEYTANRIYKTKSKVAQEAHEAIRPTDVHLINLSNLTNSIDINRDHLRLYELIWKRAVASRTADAVFDATTIVICTANGYVFEAKGSVVKFDGFLRIVGRDNDEVVIPAVAVGDTVILTQAKSQQHFTSSPPRYTEASLIKTLEEKDIGRPSTYAPIITTIQERQYVTREDKKLVPTELGNSVIDFLVKYFPAILDLPFTAKLENDLDAIANGEREWQPVLSDFYTPFEQSLARAYDTAEKVVAFVEKLDELCPTCKSPLVMRIGRYGKFVACSTFPACKYTRQYAEKIDEKCPKCDGDMIVKKSRRGKVFYGCGNYPSCTFAAWKKEDIK